MTIAPPTTGPSVPPAGPGSAAPSTAVTLPTPSTHGGFFPAVPTAPPPTPTTQRPVEAIPVFPRLDADQQAAVQAFADRLRRRYGSGSIGFSLAYQGTPVASWVWSGDPAVRLSAGARFRLASLSKVITAMTVLRLADAGKIDLDRPFIAYWRPNGSLKDSRMRTVTVRQLLNQTSGIAKLKNTFFGTDAQWRDTATQAATRNLVTAPGSTFGYSNANYTILGRVIEGITGRPYDDSVRELLLAPAGITTAEILGTEVQPNGDPRYVVTPGRHYMEALGPAGAWTMSANDLARLMSLQASSTPLLAEATERARRRPSGVDTRSKNWQYGLGAMTFAEGPGHTGTIEAAHNFALAMPNGYSVVVLIANGPMVEGGEVYLAMRDQLAALAELGPPAT